MTDVLRVVGIVDKSGVSFLLLHVSLLVRSCETKLLRLAAELFLLLDSRYPPFAFVIGGLGLDCFALERLLTVAETGILGGGILSCLTGGWECCWNLCCGIEGCSVASTGPAEPLFELPLFQVKLSLRLSELIDDGVLGSSVVGPGVGDLGGNFSVFSARGPTGFWC